KRKPEETERGLDLDRLEKRIREALMPDVLETADAVLQHLHPIDEVRGFTSEVFLNEVDPQYLRPVRNLLTARSALRVAARDRNNEAGYLVHADLYATLARIRARELAIISQRAPRPALWGGNLGQAAIADGRAERQALEERRQLADFSQAGRAPADGSAQEALKHAIWNEMLSVMALDLAAAARIQHPNVKEQATAARDAPQPLAQTNDRLRSFLKDAEDYKIGGVDQKYSDMRGKLADSPNGVALLDEVDADLQSILRPLLLLPEVGLLQELIDRLEEPAQRDDGQ